MRVPIYLHMETDTVKGCPVCCRGLSVLYTLDCGHALCLPCIKTVEKYGEWNLATCPMCGPDKQKMHPPSLLDCAAGLAVMDPRVVLAIKDDAEFLEFALDACWDKICLSLARHSYSSQQKEILWDALYPCMSRTRRSAIEITRLYSMPSVNLLYGPLSSDSDLIPPKVLSDSPLLHSIREACIFCIERAKGAKIVDGKGLSIRFQGIDYLRTRVTLKDGTEMNLFQYGIYMTDDWKSYMQDPHPPIVQSCARRLAYCIEHGHKVAYIDDPLDVNECLDRWMERKYMIPCASKVYNCIKRYRLITKLQVKRLAFELLPEDASKWARGPGWLKVLEKVMTIFGAFIQLNNDIFKYIA